jgi:hypothetical protein
MSKNEFPKKVFVKKMKIFTTREEKIPRPDFPPFPFIM